MVGLLMCKSLSARRAWIEMYSINEVYANFESLSARRAWIEMCSVLGLSWYIRSLSARRAWIEMYVRSYSQF